MLYKFYKYEGAGNDFILFDYKDMPQSFPEEITAKLCDRHFGIGADGILLVTPEAEKSWRMRILNSDGSEAEMCGNGLRCVAKHVGENDEPTAKGILISTMVGESVCEFYRETNGSIELVECKVGKPNFDTKSLGREGEEFVDMQLEAQGLTLRGTFVDMGNPHFVCFDKKELSEIEKTWGPIFENHPFFPNRTNVEFVELKSAQRIEAIVWERGVGITMACGSGACAIAAAAIKTRRASFEMPVAVELPGGTLIVTQLNNESWLKGPAHKSFEGSVEIPQ